MNKDLKELTNIGIPIYKPLKLRVFEMTDLCSINKGKSITLERNLRKEIQNKVDTIVGRNNMSEKRSYINYIDFFSNDNSVSTFDVKRYRRVANIFENLIGLDTLNENSYMDLKSRIEKELNDFDSLTYYVFSNPYTKEVYNYIKNKYMDLYNQKKSIDLRTFLNNQNAYYEGVYKKLDYINEINYEELISEYVDCLNPEKLSLYIAYNYLLKVKEACLDDKKYNPNYPFLYISAFLRSGIDKKTKIYPDYSIEFSYENVKKEFDRLMKEYKLEDLYYKRSLFEENTKEENISIINSLLKIQKVYETEKFIKPGHNETERESTGIKRKRRDLTFEDLLMIEDYVKEKEFEYLKHEPIAKLECMDSFSNYVGFLYENGIIACDRLKNVNSLSELKADSIYFFKADSYDESIKKNKQELRRESDIKPLNHTGNWKERLSNIINMPTDEKTQNEAKNLVLRKSINDGQNN